MAAELSQTNSKNVAVDASFSASWTHRLRCTTDAWYEDGPLHEVFDLLQPLKLLVVMDEGLALANPNIMESVQKFVESAHIDAIKPLIVKGGEDAKNDMGVVNQVLNAINKNKLCRQSCVLVIGGGAVLDAVGYATSIAHRGVHLIRMPSTTLSQCDSGVGVKNGVNYFGKKNFVGVFDPPFAVVNDSSLLLSLDDRHWRSGLSETVKVSLVKDEAFFELIESSANSLVQRDIDVMTSIAQQSAMFHLKHIADGGDPFERLDARPLDFGHWAAHKLEQLTHHELTHGEAVSIGISIDVTCSVLLGYLEKKIAHRTIALLENLGLPTSHPSMESPALLDGIEEFREHLGGALTLMMLKGIGKPVNVHQLDHKVVAQAIAELL